MQKQAEELISKRDDEYKRNYERYAGTRRTLPESKYAKELVILLTGFAEEIANTRVLDPACGSGNFLYVALKRLLDLEKEVATFAARNGVSGMFLRTDPSQLYGIEINTYAHELASVVVWIGYIQWLRDNGFGAPSQPILKRLDNIKQMDAILAYDEQGKPVEPEWPQADVIIGNPPFLGGSKVRRELGNAYAENLWSLYRDRIPGAADLVAYWFEKARALLEAGVTKRIGLLATQGIRGGWNRRVLERIKASGDIFWAESDREWILEGANVHVSMVGFDDGSELNRKLDGSSVGNINADLTAESNFASAQRLLENANLSFKGTFKGGPFEIDAGKAMAMLADTGNPNGRSNSDVVRPSMNGLDLTSRSRGMWIIDFGVGLSMEQAALYEAPFEYVKRNVYPIRSQDRRASYAEKWWQHSEARPALRTAIKSLPRFVGTPLTAKHRLFVWLTHPVLPDQAIIVIARDDDYFFGVLHSRLHELWARKLGSQLREAESGMRYTPTSTFETFPFPWPPGKEPKDDPRVQAIAEAARELVRLRDNWLNPPSASDTELKKRTLTNLYNQRPTWLDNAHRKLDRAVLDAYGWRHDLSDEEILARLLALNLERSANQGKVQPSKPAEDSHGEEE